jgi:type II secretory pathway pseudopilin PulG
MGRKLHRARRQAGLTYLALLFFVAVMGALLAMTGLLWSTAQQRQKERELLFIGNAYRAAIGAYYESTPGTVKRYPATLAALLRDDRQAAMVRHLRRIYLDPMTLSAEWGTVAGPDGGIMGVYSRSDGEPVKHGGFDSPYRDFVHARHYSEWRFVYVVGQEVSPNPKSAPTSKTQSALRSPL